MRIPTPTNLVCLALGAASVLQAQQQPEHVPGAYIVELEADSSADAFYQTLGVPVEQRMDLRHKLFNGVSFQVNDTGAWRRDQHERLLIGARSQREVRNIWPVQIVRLQTGKVEKPGTKGTASSSSSLSRLTRRQAIDNSTEEDTFTTHLMTQVNKLHAMNITGKGFRVGIVDSGVDYTHPALGGCFGPGCLVEAGWDFTGDTYLPPGNPQPDPDPMDDCEGHGTHVTGILAAQLAGNEFGFTGAAPGVKIAMYRAWGCRATSTTEILIAAFLRAFDEGADIISCSDGKQNGWQDDAWGLVASRIVEAGVPVIVADGNDGSSGLFYAMNPASGAGVTATGSVDNSVIPFLTSAGKYQIGGSNATATSFGYLVGAPASPEQGVTLSLWAASNDTTSINDACSPLPDDTPDLSDKWVLLRVPDTQRGCFPTDQAANIAAKGGKNMVYYTQTNLTYEEQYIYLTGIDAVISVPPYQGAEWIDQLSQGREVTVSIPGANATGQHLEQLGNSVTGGYTSTFTSWGPTWEMQVKPQFTAPGGKILSTYPQAMGTYAVLSGTSMTAPLIAGIYALLGEVRGTLDPDMLTRIVSATAKPLTWNDGTDARHDILAPVSQQGAGLAQAFDAAFSTLMLSTHGISFNDSDHFVGTHTFTVENSGSEAVVLDIDHSHAATVYYFPNDGNSVRLPSSFPNPMVDAWADLTFSSTSVSVPAGGSANITVSATPPSGLNATLLPVYSGYITLNSSNASLSLPYVGLAGSLHATPVLQPSFVYLANYNLPVGDNQTYTLPRPDPTYPYLNSTVGDEAADPNLYLRPTVGTRSLRVDLVSLDGGGANNNTVVLEGTGIRTMGSLPDFPLAPYGRAATRAYFKGQLGDGSVVPEGMYRMVVSALRIFGDRERAEDWDVVETSAFNLRYSD